MNGPFLVSGSPSFQSANAGKPQPANEPAEERQKQNAVEEEDETLP
jgi:hypothetical protein